MILQRVSWAKTGISPWERGCAHVSKLEREMEGEGGGTEVVSVETEKENPEAFRTKRFGF